MIHGLDCCSALAGISEQAVPCGLMWRKGVLPCGLASPS